MLMNLSNPCLQLIYKHSLHQIDHLCDLNYCWFHYLTAYPAILFVYTILTLYGLLWKGFVLFVLMKSLFLHSHNLLQYYLNLNQWYFSMFISPESAWLSRWLILFINLLALWNEVLSISKIICIPRSLVVLWLFIVHSAVTEGFIGAGIFTDGITGTGVVVVGCVSAGTKIGGTVPEVWVSLFNRLAEFTWMTWRLWSLLAMLQPWWLLYFCWCCFWCLCKNMLGAPHMIKSCTLCF